jgi:actin-like ATPase involved in cell morphogenesis
VCCGYEAGDACRPRHAAIRPLKEGVIVDFEVTRRCLYFIAKVHNRRL